MSMKMVCNRCNKVKEDGETFDRVDHKARSVNPYEDFTYDLCPECSKLFRMFLDGGTVEEDRYKDSKPSAVVIHKLASGHYAIENVPKEDDQEEHANESIDSVLNNLYNKEESGHTCETCTHRFESALDVNSPCYACGKEIEDNWEPAGESIDKGAAMDKEESDLSTPCHTNAAGVTVPDGYPWGKADKVCPRCGGDGYERGTDGFDIRGDCELCKGTGKLTHTARR